MKKLQTVCIIRNGDKILLGLKKRGFGVGRWNGFGGKVEEGETPEESTRREVKEEIGVDVEDLEKIGILEFKFEDSGHELEVHFFKSEHYRREPKESDEMHPQWFDVNDIPFNKMWPDDRYWMPIFLKGKKFRGRFLFNKPSTSEETSIILNQELFEVEEL